MAKPTPEELREALKQVRLFADLPDPVLDRLTPFTLLRHVRAGESIFLQTEPSPYCFGILSGRVLIQRVSKDQKGPVKRLGDLGPGEMFGESSLFGKTLRTATATALTDGSLVAVSGQKLQDWIQEHPEHGVPLVMGLLESSMDRLQKTSLELSVIYGVERLLGGAKPFDEALPEVLTFLESALSGIDQFRVFTRNVSWEEYARLGGPEEAALAFAHPFVHRIRECETSSQLQSAELDAWKVRGSVVDKDMEAVAVVPFWNRDQYPAVMEGFLLVAARQKNAITPEMLRLLSTVSLTLTEEILRVRRVQEAEAFERLTRTRSSYPK